MVDKLKLTETKFKNFLDRTLNLDRKYKMLKKNSDFQQVKQAN